MLSERILVINPGSSGTKVSLFHGQGLEWSEGLGRDPAERNQDYIEIELEGRLEQLRTLLRDKNVTVLNAVVGRGGLLSPVPGGTYKVNSKMCQDARESRRGIHASNLGCLLAREIGEQYEAPSYIVDPVSTDELTDYARVSGLRELPRQSLAHFLSIKSVYRTAISDLQLHSGRIIVCHLGSGISVAAVDGGRVIDTTNANDDGPFSPERAGSIPAGDLVRLAFSEDISKSQLVAELISNSGLKGYLDTPEAREIEDRITKGDEYAQFIYEAMIYQIAKEVGAMAAVLSGKVDAIILTGGLAYSGYVVDALKARLRFVARFLVYPGEREMESLADGALRVLRGDEKAKRYPEGDDEQ